METQQEVTNNSVSVTDGVQQEVQQELSNTQRVKGQVKWFNSKKGFGFITYKEGEKDNDIFVHHTCIKYHFLVLYLLALRYPTVWLFHLFE